MKTLFIGGPADGKWLDIPECENYWNIPEELPGFPVAERLGMTYTFRKFEYRRMKLFSGDVIHSVMVLPGSGDLIISLLAGYRCPNE